MKIERTWDSTVFGERKRRAPQMALIAQALGHQAQDFAFPVAEQCDRIGTLPPVEKLFGHQWVNDTFTCGDATGRLTNSSNFADPRP